MNISSQIIGIIAGTLTAISLVPQLFKTIRDKKADEISLIIFLLLLAGNGLWCYYGVLREDYPIIITNGFSCIVDMSMLFLKVKYSKQN